MDDSVDVTALIDAGAITFTVSLSNPVDVDTSVEVSTNDGTALLGDGDYMQIIGQTLDFAAGVTSQTFEVIPTADSTVEPDETFTVTLETVSNSGRNVVASVVAGAGTIVNDDFLAATDDTVTTVEDTEVTINVLANDNYADNGSLVVTLNTDAANGTVINNGDGTVSYTPNTDFNGSDSFTYTIDDGNGGIDTATVNITVTAVNDVPVAEDDTATTDEDSAVTVAVLNNDSDIDGDVLNIAGVTDGSNGTVTIVGTDVVYTPVANFNGIDTFTYIISDGELTATATVTVTVNAVNDAPAAIDDSATTDEDAAVTISVLSNDSDADGDALSIAGVTDGSNGTAAIVGTDVIYTPNQDFNGADSFTYTVEDGNGGTATATVTVTVNTVNDAPVAVEDAVTTDEDFEE